MNFNVFLKSVWFTVNWPKEASIMEMIRPLFRSAKSLAKSAFTSNYLPLFYIIHDIEMTITRKFSLTQNIQLFHSQYSYLTVLFKIWRKLKISNLIYDWLEISLSYMRWFIARDLTTIYVHLNTWKSALSWNLQCLFTSMFLFWSRTANIV